MTLLDIIKSLPNGFHDSSLEAIMHNLVENSVSLSLNVWLDEGPKKNKYEGKKRKCSLKFSELRYFSYETALFMPNRDKKDLLGPAWVDIGHEYNNVAKPPGYLGGSNSGWIFFNDFNGFIHFDSENIEFKWIG